jgi:hypothetical protein
VGPVRGVGVLMTWPGITVPTVLRVPLKVTKPGTYRLQVHADGIGQVVNRTARIRFVANRPASPLWQEAGPLRVVVVKGLRVPQKRLAAALGSKYEVSTVADAALYAAVDPNDPRAAAAVVVDLASVPLPSLASLHALLPELRIIGVTADRALATAAQGVGVRSIVVSRAPTPGVVKRIKSLIPVR